MEYTVKVSNGDVVRLEGPEGLSEAEVQAFVAEQLGAQGKSYANAPNTVLPTQPEAGDPESGLLSDIGTGVAEIGRGALSGAANVLDHAADWTQGGLNALGQAVAGSRWGDRLNGGQQNQLTEAVGQGTPGLDTLNGIGRFAGETLATAPLGALRGGAAVQGLASGALLSDSTDATGLVMDAGAGLIGAKGAQSLLRGAARLADPVVDEGLRTLINSGVRATPGQVGRSSGSRLGKFVARTEDRAMSTPFVGDRIVSDRNQSLDDFARAAITRAVEPIGLTLPQGGGVRRSVRWAGDQLSAAYNSLLPNLRVQGDDQFLGELSAIHSDAQTLAPARVKQFNSILTDLGRYWQQDTALDGAALKSIDTRLSERIRRFSSANDADQQDLGDALQAVRDAILDMAGRQNPDYASRLQAINRGWKSLTQVERASANSKANITPAGYSQAVKQSSDTVRRRGYARGEALNQDLSDAGSDILPAEIADSGTATRAAQSNLIYLGLGAAQLPVYAGMRAATPLATRETATSPGLAKLLEYGARAAPVAAPAAIDVLRR
jgi:hypothetical protein